MRLRSNRKKRWSEKRRSGYRGTSSRIESGSNKKRMKNLERRRSSESSKTGRGGKLKRGKR